ncbi:putative mitochondrial transferase CAF17 precursor [Triangularia setosa]|uniref:Iron-sulfur cluster assembly factor IBA57 homolog, mitochondrial n=1 Tax=Triangularia setosa TaxID=2587417 RepID=A0AAN6WDJ1_9PEZI|nr:putative mitochondrial transferase CAF17 precursor [Podospora setosa]
MQPVIRRRIAVGAGTLPSSARIFSSVPSPRPSSLPTSPPQSLSRPKQTPLYLPRQRHHRPFSVSSPLLQETSSQSTPSDSGLPTSGISRLASRSLISLSGPDAAKFLRGIITNELPTDHNTLAYAAFLSAQGRVLNDVLVYLDPRSRASSPPDSFLVEVSTAEAATLTKHLKRYKLRSKCTISLLAPEQANVYAVWGSSDFASTENTHYYPDARFPSSESWRRLLTFGAEPQPATTEPEQTYHLLRFTHGIPESQSELIRDSALPHESNLDLLGGIDFRKGCYVGQELTIRTEHRGVVRKRILPAMLYPSSSPSPPAQLRYSDEDLAGKIAPGTNVTRLGRRGRPAGKWLGGIGNLGLVLGRLEMMTDLKLPGEAAVGVGMGFKEGDEFEVEVGGQGEGQEGDDGGKVRVKAFVPGWLRERLEEKMEKKERRRG